MDIQIGIVTRYYDALHIAVVEVLNQTLKVGDKVKISGLHHEFVQDVVSLQVEYKAVTEVAVGEVCGLLVDKPVEVGDVLFLLTRAV
jgi:NifB/MoaA-like Fe-S oxidoreductase